jgi:hypothetical protein
MLLLRTEKEPDFTREESLIFPKVPPLTPPQNSFKTLFVGAPIRQVIPSQQVLPTYVLR